MPDRLNFVHEELEVMARRGDGSPADNEAPAFVVEENGINLIPEAKRTSKPNDLFWIWCGANIILTYIITGSLLTRLELSTPQMLAVVLSGNLFYVLVGYGGIPGARVGTTTLVISRAAFGRRGNSVPCLLSWLTVVGWEAVNLVLGAFAVFALFDGFGWPLGPSGKAAALALLSVFTFGVAVLGHATIVVLQRWFTWGLGIVVLGLVPQVWGASSGPAMAHAGEASSVAVCLAFTLVASLPISFANYPADYTRYLPRHASGTSIVFWTFLGAYVPAVLLSMLGYFAAKATDLSDPVAGFQPLLHSWYFHLFIATVLGGTITNNFLNTYSSGLSLLALGLNVSRPTAVILDALLAGSIAAYAIFFHDFTSAFIAFLSLMVFWLAPWTGVYVADIWLRGSSYRGLDLLSPDGGIYGYRSGWHVTGFVSWLCGCAAALMCTATDQFASPFAVSFLGGADVSVAAGFLVAATMYLGLASVPAGSKALSFDID